MDLAGVAIPDAMQGFSIAPLLNDDGKGAGVRNTNIVEIWDSTFAGNLPILAGYDGRFEVFYTYDLETSLVPSYVEVYDLQSDPWELNNLAGELPNHPAAFSAWSRIDADIQQHRVNNLGTFEHSLINIGSGEVFEIETNLPQPDGTADQTIPEIVAASITGSRGSLIAGDGIVMGDLRLEPQAVLELGESGSSSGDVLVSMSFNDLLTGQLTNQGGGMGWTGVWGSVNSPSGGPIDVVGGNLIPHPSTNYSISKQGSPMSIIRSANGASTDRRDLQTTLTGEVWFSFLAKVDSDGRAGINIDGHGGFFG